jgi:hypothetical protein
MVFLVQCTEDSVNPADEGLSAGRGSGGGVRGGGHTETVGNNLSFPAFLLDGYSVIDVPTDLFTVVYSGNYSGLTADEIAYVEANGPWYPQKTEGNVWQADYSYADNVTINWIDWGDAIEAVNPKIGRPYRLELSLYVDGLVTPMEAFTMAELEFPSSSKELQGTNTTTYFSSVATVASPYGDICVQDMDQVDIEALLWDPIENQWYIEDGFGVRTYPPKTDVNFQVENNVGGKLIFGASTGGFKPTVLHPFRITFYLEGGSGVLIDRNTKIGNYNGDGSSFTEVIEGETNTPVVDGTNGLSYVDVMVVQNGGGGKSGGKGKPDKNLKP